MLHTAYFPNADFLIGSDEAPFLRRLKNAGHMHHSVVCNRSIGVPKLIQSVINLLQALGLVMLAVSCREISLAAVFSCSSQQ